MVSVLDSPDERKGRNRHQHMQTGSNKAMVKAADTQAEGAQFCDARGWGRQRASLEKVMLEHGLLR